MCGRYTNDAEFSEIRLTFEVEQLELFRDWKPARNISPTQGAGYEQLFIVVNREGKTSLRLGRWWMIPSFWNRPLRELPTAFNARADEVHTRPFWRSAFLSSRCVVPATGWREFKGRTGKKKQPYHFHLGRRLFAFAGVCSTWTSPDGEAIDSFAILTTDPHPVARTVHDRMPLVLTPSRAKDWLSKDQDPLPLLRALERESQALPLDVYPSNPIGNRSGYDGPEVLDPVPEHGTEPAQQELFLDLPPHQSRSRTSK